MINLSGTLKQLKLKEWPGSMFLRFCELHVEQSLFARWLFPDSRYIWPTGWTNTLRVLSSVKGYWMAKPIFLYLPHLFVLNAPQHSTRTTVPFRIPHATVNRFSRRASKVINVANVYPSFKFQMLWLSNFKLYVYLNTVVVVNLFVFYILSTALNQM